MERDHPAGNQTIGDAFDQAVEQWGDKQAVVVSHQDIRWTYRELGAAIDAFAAGLLSLDLQPGDRIGIWSPNNIEWLITQFATAKAGLIMVNINPAYRKGELSYTLKKVACKALVLASEFKSSDYIGMLRDIAPGFETSGNGRTYPSTCAGQDYRRAGRRGTEGYFW